jgi:protein arginine kinase
MKLRELLTTTRGKWIEGGGPSSDIVISSRVRLARNIADHAFPQRANAEKCEELVELAGEAVEKCRSGVVGDGLELYRLDSVEPLEKQVLVEKHLISPMQARKGPGAAVVLRADEAVSIMINEEDHLRLQCLMPGLDLEGAWELCSAVDDELGEQLDYAFSHKHGYLTACPTNVGTGLRASVMMHLPGLVHTEQAGRMFSAIGKVGMAVRGIYGEGTEALGNLFQISNQITLGRTEQEIRDNLKSVTLQLLESERSARERLRSEWGVKLEDRVTRAYGILANARVIPSEEALKLLSRLRLGIDLNVLGHIKRDVFNRLLVAIRPGFIQLAADENLDAEARDQKRAKLIREHIEASEKRV